MVKNKKTKVKTIQMLADEFIEQRTENSFNILIKRLSPGIHKHIMEIVPSQQRRVEVINDVFVKVWTKIDQYNKDVGQFSTWVYKIAYNEALLSIRYNAKLSSIDSGTDGIKSFIMDSAKYSYKINDEFDEPLTSDVIDQVYDLATNAITNFPSDGKYKKWKRAFILKDIDNYQFNEIAKIMNENENTVKGWVCKARKELAKILETSNPQLIENYRTYKYENA